MEMTPALLQIVKQFVSKLLKYGVFVFLEHRLLYIEA